MIDVIDYRAGNARSVMYALEHLELLCLADGFLHGCRVELAVGLGARPAHRRPLAAVEHAELDAAAIGHAAHQAVQGVDLAHQMAFAESSDRRIARHRADGREPVGQERGAGAHACRGGRGFAARVAAADHDDVEILFHRRCSRRADVAKRSPGVKVGAPKTSSCAVIVRHSPYLPWRGRSAASTARAAGVG